MVRCEHLDAFSDAARCSMTDQEADSEEEGRSLPLPPNIDAQSDQRSNADSRACEADGGEMYPEPSATFPSFMFCSFPFIFLQFDVARK